MKLLAMIYPEKFIFLVLSMENAKIYNLDHNPVDICKWWELDNMKHYFNLFDNARDNFKNHKVRKKDYL